MHKKKVVSLQGQFFFKVYEDIDESNRACDSVDDTAVHGVVQEDCTSQPIQW